MALGDRIRARRKGGYDLRLPPDERAILRSIPGQMRDLLSEDDPSLVRLYPPGHEDDAERDAEFRALTRSDLTAGRLESLRIMEETADAERLTHEQVVAWLNGMNDMRLVLGTRLDVSEDPEAEARLASGPDASAFALYSYLGLLVEQAVRALSEGLEPPPES
jgi:hypothetical protein